MTHYLSHGSSAFSGIFTYLKGPDYVHRWGRFIHTHILSNHSFIQTQRKLKTELQETYVIASQAFSIFISEALGQLFTTLIKMLVLINCLSISAYQRTAFGFPLCTKLFFLWLLAVGFVAKWKNTSHFEAVYGESTDGSRHQRKHKQTPATQASPALVQLQKTLSLEITKGCFRTEEQRNHSLLENQGCLIH